MLVWSDEFDSGSTPVAPDAAHWGYELGYVRNLGTGLGSLGWIADVEVPAAFDVAHQVVCDGFEPTAKSPVMPTFK